MLCVSGKVLRRPVEIATQSRPRKGEHIKQIPARFWNAVGWVGLLLTAWSFILATIDGVMAIFVIPIAMLVGGVSGLGATSTARFGIATIVLCTALVFAMTNYRISAGLIVPSVFMLTRTFEFVGIPLTAYSENKTTFLSNTVAVTVQPCRRNEER